MDFQRFTDTTYGLWFSNNDGVSTPRVRYQKGFPIKFCNYSCADLSWNSREEEREDGEEQHPWRAGGESYVSGQGRGELIAKYTDRQAALGKIDRVRELSACTYLDIVLPESKLFDTLFSAWI